MVRPKKIPVIWDIEAVLYLREIIKYIRKESEQGAKSVKSGILKSVKLLSENPEIFEEDRFKESNDGSYRAFTVYSYRITYRITSENIRILRIRHTSQEPLEY
jgi:plasmid stabilization system protein ParE